MHIPFNKPYLTGNELAFIAQAINNGQLSEEGPFTKKCQMWLESHIGCTKAFLTPSCTSAIEMAANLADIQEGDEVIMPSFSFCTTANAFVIRGGVPVFVDIRQDTLNIDEAKIEEAITPRTKAIITVHYAGVSCAMEPIMTIAERYNLLVIEDAAHSIMSFYKGKPLGSIGHIGGLSFHETKNIISGNGGAILINDSRFLDRTEIIREYGTNRRSFLRGEIENYTWLDVGSSLLSGEMVAAFLYAQIDKVDFITKKRLEIWKDYHEAFADIELQGKVRRPTIPEGCQHNAHIYYLLLPNSDLRDRLISYLKDKGIQAVFHYVPLHNSPAGLKYSRSHGDLSSTLEVSSRLIRLPLWVGLSSTDVARVIDSIKFFISKE